MNRRVPFGSSLAFLAAFHFVAVLTSCGGSGGSGHPAAVPGPSGTVTVLVTDGPSLAFDHIFIDITKLTLLGSNDTKRVVLFEGRERIDLLQYRGDDFLLVSRIEVPAGRYEKIRLEVDDIDVEPDDECPEVKLPSGKIDLNPRGGFEVAEGEAIFIRLDIDAKKSFSLHEAGKSGKCVFRPVVFIDVKAEEIDRCPQEFAGTIVRTEQEDNDEDDDHMEWRRARHGVGESDHGDDGDGDDDHDDDNEDDDDDEDNEDEDDDDELIELVIDIDGDRGEVQVEVKSSTLIFNSQALGGSTGDLQAGDHVVVRGELEFDGEIEAIWVIDGSPLEVKGTFDTAISEGKFTLSSDGDSVEGHTTSATRAFPPCEDSPIPLAMIVPGQAGRILGFKVTEGEGEAAVEEFRAAVIDVGLIRTKGEITSIDALNGKITLKAGETLPEIDVDGRTEIKLVGDGFLTFGDLRVGQTLTASLEPGEDRADLLEVDPEGASGEVTALNLAARTFVLVPDGEPPPGGEAEPVPEIEVTVAPGATIVLIEGDSTSQVDLSTLKNGDRVAVFGLIPAENLFDARTVVIRR